MIVIKRDGSKVKFDPNKIRRWVQWSIKSTKSITDVKKALEMEHHVLMGTISRLPEEVTTKAIHETMIRVCLDKNDIDFSRVAARLELGSIHKAQEHLLGILKPESASFMEVAEALYDKGIWDGEWFNKLSVDVERYLDAWAIKFEALDLEYWQIKQFVDKYGKKINDEVVETPAQAAIGIALALHGYGDLSYKLAKAIITGKGNLPTPVLTGCRDGVYDVISCCLIEAEDTVDSIDMADFIASGMTARKAGIGITIDSRSKGEAVKKGAVKHLGKLPLYFSVEKGVKKYTQIARGGSATMTFKCIDPDIMQMLLWKTQRIDVTQRVDKIDYTFAYNDAFVEAVINGEDWYLFGRSEAPEVHENFHSKNYMDYVKSAVRRGVKFTKVPAINVLMEFIKSRWETGRIYCLNVTRANEHTPFIIDKHNRISQSNLCLEITLPTRGYIDLYDLASEKSVGETAFCAIAAVNVAKVTEEEYFDLAYVMLKTVDVMIEKAGTLTKCMKNDMLRRRSVGMGITGLASYLYSRGLDYDGSPESLRACQDLAEIHYYSLLKASQRMAEEDGIAVEGVDFNWLPIDTAKGLDSLYLDWESLRGKPRKHSVLVAHMPTESSSLFSDSSNGLYPARDKVVYKKARQGKVQYINVHYDPTKHLDVYRDIDLVPYYGIFADLADQAISCDYYTDYTQYPNNKVPMSVCVDWFIRQALRGVKTAYYQNFREKAKETTPVEVEEDTGCESGGCKL